MDLTNRPRHTHRTIARLRTMTVSEAEFSASRFSRLLRDAVRSDAGEGIPETAGVPRIPPVAAHSRKVDIYDPALEATPASWQPLAMLAEQIANQAGRADNFSQAVKQELHDSIQRAFPDVSGEQGEAGAATRSPEELLQRLKDVVWQAGVVGESGERRTLFAPAVRATASPVKLRRRRVVPKVETLPDGLRIERFDSGAQLVKNEIGRVVEVVSAAGECISYSYDSAENLDSFMRADQRGRLHSEGRRDKHGVVVRDPQGRVRAAGESMTVSPSGCLCIHNHDGQFVSIDLLAGVHLERRNFTGEGGKDDTVTAVFAHDGFRMATRFHQGAAADGPAGGGDARVVEHLRFYGRDGSLVDFDCEEDLRALSPARVLSPGSVRVDAACRGKKQAGTAWEAVEEYLSIIS